MNRRRKHVVLGVIFTANGFFLLGFMMALWVIAVAKHDPSLQPHWGSKGVWLGLLSLVSAALWFKPDDKPKEIAQ